MVITNETVSYVASLAKIELSDGEKEARAKDLSDVLAYIEKLNELDTDGVSEMAHPFETFNKNRPDAVTNAPAKGELRDELMGNAPDIKGEYFRVMKVL
jgi:aspartyl-tRNA(Asn)/glutamyl-tRNA(Gln) amidotransferase subunit C